MTCYRSGKFTPRITDANVIAAFVHRLRTLNSDRGCWEWYGSIDRDDYGVFYIGRHQYRAHRIAYAIWKGEIPEGYTINHECCNRTCVNPDHLTIVTHSENVAERNRRNPHKGAHRHGDRSPDHGELTARERAAIAHLPV